MPHRIDASFDGDRKAPFLCKLCADLLARQKKCWPHLRDGYAGLDAALTREIAADGYSVKLQYNPRRIVSSAAAVDPESIRRRRCFLCIESLPEEQLRILYRGAYLILCNPAPFSRNISPFQTGCTFPRQSKTIWLPSCSWPKTSDRAGRSSTTDPNAAPRHRITCTFRPLPRA